MCAKMVHNIDPAADTCRSKVSGRGEGFREIPACFTDAVSGVQFHTKGLAMHNPFLSKPKYLSGLERTNSTDWTSLTPFTGLAFGCRKSRVNNSVTSQVLLLAAILEFEGCPMVEATMTMGYVCSEFATVCSSCAVAPAAAHRLM